MTTNIAKTTAADQKIVDGCNKRLLTLASVTVAGTAMKPLDVVAKVQSRIDAATALAAATAAFHKAVANNTDTSTQTHQFMLDLRATIRVLFGTDVVALADFGLEPPRPRTKKPATLVAAAQKAKATRAARGTKGSKQKKAIKGAAAAAEPVTPPAPAATPTPAK
jgi:type I site-specific restriction endonuclease